MKENNYYSQEFSERVRQANIEAYRERRAERLALGFKMPTKRIAKEEVRTTRIMHVGDYFVHLEAAMRTCITDFIVFLCRRWRPAARDWASC